MSAMRFGATWVLPIKNYDPIITCPLSLLSRGLNCQNCLLLIQCSFFLFWVFSPSIHLSFWVFFHSIHLSFWVFFTSIHLSFWVFLFFDSSLFLGFLFAYRNLDVGLTYCRCLWYRIALMVLFSDPLLLYFAGLFWCTRLNQACIQKGEMEMVM